MSVWVAQGYALPAVIDDPANGGNGDGIVCHKQLNDVQAAKFCATITCGGGVIYSWVENFRAEKPRMG